MVITFLWELWVLKKNHHPVLKLEVQYIFSLFQCWRVVLSEYFPLRHSYLLESSTQQVWFQSCCKIAIWIATLTFEMFIWNVNVWDSDFNCALNICDVMLLEIIMYVLLKFNPWLISYMYNCTIWGCRLFMVYSYGMNIL